MGIESDIEDLQQQISDLTEVVVNFIKLSGKHDKECLYLWAKQHIESRKIIKEIDRGWAENIHLECCCKQVKIHSKKCHEERTCIYYLRQVEERYCNCGAIKIKLLTKKY